MSTGSVPALSVAGLVSGYGTSVVVDGVTIQIHAGEVVALLGRNGVGKSTLAASVAGQLPTQAGAVAIDGKDATSMSASARFRHGLRSVRQDQPLFSDLSVAENLKLVGADVDKAAQVFPFLDGRGSQLASTLSGGEQKMLAMARQAANPGRVWILDEPTEGLQPKNVDKCTELIRAAASNGCAVLLIEQHLAMALQAASRFYLMEKGKIALEGPVDDTTRQEVAGRLAV